MNESRTPQDRIYFSSAQDPRSWDPEAPSLGLVITCLTNADAKRAESLFNELLDRATRAERALSETALKDAAQQAAQRERAEPPAAKSIMASAESGRNLSAGAALPFDDKSKRSLIYRLHNWCNEDHGADVAEHAQDLMVEAAERLEVAQSLLYRAKERGELSIAEVASFSGDSDETLKRIGRLLDQYANLNFDCGEHDGQGTESENDYDALNNKTGAKRLEIDDAIKALCARSATSASGDQHEASLLADEIESVGKGLAIDGKSIEGGRELTPEEDALIVAALRAYAPSETEPKLPNDVRDFIRYVTLELQAHRSRTEAQKDALFQRAYRLYAQYRVEGEGVMY